VARGKGGKAYASGLFSGGLETLQRSVDLTLHRTRDGHPFRWPSMSL